MSTIRRVDVKNFRGIRDLSWCPVEGINCLVGPGDSGKSTILDAIDLCLGARRSIQFSDSDFFELNVEAPIVIDLTVGNLGASMLSIESYGLFLRSFNVDEQTIDDEPHAGGDTVLTVRLQVEGDLEPSWTLYSERAIDSGVTRGLNWADRVLLAPTRMSVATENHLSWRRGSLLHRLSADGFDASVELARAAREARSAFGQEMQEKLQETLDMVYETATDLGVRTNEGVQALLDAQQIAFRGGAISLHDAHGVPLGALGTGSSRLLTTGLHRRANRESKILLMDELEYGLEPHRIIRLISSLGAKDSPPPFQAFLTTHSPVALRELSGDQLFLVRKRGGSHQALQVGTRSIDQGTIRSFPDAFLAQSVIICEGATEVGLIRGIDQWRVDQGDISMHANGVSLVDIGGGDLRKVYERAQAFMSLGYRVAVFRDADLAVDEVTESAFTEAGGTVFTWEEGRALEDALFLGLADLEVLALLDYVVDIHGEAVVDGHIRSIDRNSSLEAIRAGGATISRTDREILGRAAKRKRGWLKTVSHMEQAARTIVAPGLDGAEPGLRNTVAEIFRWALPDV